MSLFQASIVKKYLSTLDPEAVTVAYENFKRVYSAGKIQNIRALKEEQYQEGFIKDVFGSVLGYTVSPEEHFNIETEKKNETNARKADGAILKDDKVIGVIELKDNKTKNLDAVKDQAFGYKNNHKDCSYVISSNFHKLRFYIDDATEYEEFDLYNLDKDTFQKFYLFLRKEGLLDKNVPRLLRQETRFHEELISKQLYNDYSSFKNSFFENALKNNPQHDKLLLYKKSQKFLDRILFLLFAEDKGLLGANSLITIIEKWIAADEDYAKPLYEMINVYFDHLYTGFTYQKTGEVIPAFGGELFAPDEVLNKLVIDDNALKDDLTVLSKYDFNTEVDVNILGHIFEHSLNEIDDVEAEIRGEKLDKAKSKRKKDGVFYTPKYITKYIVDNTLGKLCAEKKAAMGLDRDFNISEYQKADGKLNEKGKELFKRLNDYKEWLLTLKVVDPACGSGAFLNQALSFFIEEHILIDDIIAELTNTPLRLFDTDLAILENNLYGVDINDESIEIAKLSLWLRTAQPGRKLSDLSRNIKCGNSLIDDPAVAGDKAFNWHKEFPDVFAKGGFDVVIGNPPYGAYISKEVQRFYTNNYLTASYKLDTYAIFIEKGVSITKEKGLLSYIIPYTFLTIQQHKKLREFILNYDIERIIDLPTKVFESADLDTVILLLKKEKTIDEINIGKVDNQTISLSNKIRIQDILNTSDLQININNTSVDIQLINKIKNVSNLLNKYCEVSQGYIPYRRSDLIKLFGELEGNKIVDERLWHSSVKHNDEWKQEIQGQDIGRYTYKESFQYVKYGTHVASYVNPKYFINPRIIIMEITRGNIYKLSSVYLEKEYYNTPSIINIISRDSSNILKSILPLINSRLLTWYHLKVHPKANAETSIPKILINDVRNLPISKNIDNNLVPFIEKADLMLSLNKELQEATQKFQRSIERKFALKELSNKLQDWYLLSYAEFVKELAKKKIKLTLADEAEWESYFLAEQQKAAALKAQIDKTDKEIDQMVYALYELSEEEIGIVEGS